MTRALHPGLAKRSLKKGGLDEDTASEMIAATAAGIGKSRDPGERGIEVNVVEVHGPIASVVVHSTVYREYLHLGRTEDGWKIVNALWDKA
jgi:Putative lumazine-binding